ncbi:MAG: S49 family peptidase [Acidimicrobiales bacterium]|nr:S49 family peptidase [Acidimicrobiales bacterium]
MPFQGLVARESIGRAVGRTIAKTLAAVGTFGIAVLGLLLVMGVALSGVSASSTQGDLPTSFVAGDEGNANKLLAVPVTGVILGESEGGGGFLSSLLSATYGYQVKADLEAAAERNDIKGVVLEMDTPGGTIFGSRAIADAVTAYRERTGRPVLAYVRGLSASGGMYAMAGADHIVADHGTLVGSIGVIFGPLSQYDNVIATDGGLLGGGVETTGGITEIYITAGRSKDLGNPYRPLQDEERKALQLGVDNNYETFVSHVAEGRGIEASAIKDQLGALIYDEQTALQSGLIDQVGNRDEAYVKAAELAKLKTGDWQVTRIDRAGGGLFGLGALFGEGDGPSAVPATDAALAVDVRRLLCARGPTMLAYYGALPTDCA